MAFRSNRTTARRLESIFFKNHSKEPTLVDSGPRPLAACTLRAVGSSSVVIIIKVDESEPESETLDQILENCKTHLRIAMESRDSILELQREAQILRALTIGLSDSGSVS